MTITGSNTTSFGFQKLGSNDDAGYSTINEVIDGIDTILNTSDRLIKASQTPTAAYVITGDGVDWVRGLVVTASITDLNVTTGKLAELAVTTAKINDLAVTTAKIADLNVTTGKINDLAVTTGKINDLAVTTGKINDLAVTTGKIAADAVTLGTKTSGDYVATITGTANQIASSAATSGEGTTHTLSLVSGATLPGQPIVATATGSYPFVGSARTISDVGYVDSAVANVNASGLVALSGDVGGTAGATVIGVSKVTSSMIVNDTIVNADINTAAAIVDTKLATISTASKVSNSATTATSANTASAIVARDASGNFTAGTVTVTNVNATGYLSTTAPVIKTADFTVAATENWLISNKSSSCTVTLPTVASFTGREITIKNLAAFTVVSASANVKPIGTNTAGTAILPATAGTWCTLVSDGTNWIVMQSGPGLFS